MGIDYSEEVNPDTGELLMGWEDPETGEISLDPNSGFGEGSIPLWGSAAQEAKVARAFELGLGVTHTSELSDSTQEGDWIFLEPGVQVHSSRYQQALDDDGNVIMHEGKELWTKNPKKTSGLLGDLLETASSIIPAVAIAELVTGEDLTDEVMGVVAAMVDSHLGWIIPDAVTLIGGTKLQEDYAELVEDVGLDAEDYFRITGAIKNVTSAVAMGMATVATGGAAGLMAGALVAGAGVGAQGLAQVQAYRLQGHDIDYSDAASDIAEGMALSSISFAIGGQIAGQLSGFTELGALSAKGAAMSSLRGGSSEDNLIAGISSGISSYGKSQLDTPFADASFSAGVGAAGSFLRDEETEDVIASAGIAGLGSFLPTGQFD